MAISMACSQKRWCCVSMARAWTYSLSVFRALCRVSDDDDGDDMMAAADWQSEKDDKFYTLST